MPSDPLYKFFRPSRTSDAPPGLELVRARPNVSCMTGLDRPHPNGNEETMGKPPRRNEEKKEQAPERHAE